MSAIPDWLKVSESTFEEISNIKLAPYFKSSPNEWLEDQVDNIVSKFFLARKEVEKNLTRDELIAFDKDMIKEFSKEKLCSKLRQNLANESRLIKIIADKADTYKNNTKNDEVLKTRKNSQLNQLKDLIDIKNEDAFYKLLAFNTRTEYEKDEKNKGIKQNKRRVVINDGKDEEVLIFIILIIYQANFNEFYMHKLSQELLEKETTFNAFDMQKNIKKSYLRELHKKETKWDNIPKTKDKKEAFNQFVNDKTNIVTKCNYIKTKLNLL